MNNDVRPTGPTTTGFVGNDYENRVVLQPTAVVRIEQFGSNRFTVSEGDKAARELGYDELLGTLAARFCPERCRGKFLFSMTTDAQDEAERNRVYNPNPEIES